MTKPLSILKPETPDELKECAKTVRDLADRIERGEVLSLAWAATKSASNEFETGWVKADSIQTVELIGQVEILKIRMIRNLD